jgi:glycosyltransferase involved in cell wall biosynthesis
VRESFHLGLVEGAASGAVPVVRDWPFFPGAARRLFPESWGVADPTEAAERVLEATSSEESWRHAGEEAAAHVLERWDWQVVKGRYDALLRAQRAESTR